MSSASIISWAGISHLRNSATLGALNIIPYSSFLRHPHVSKLMMSSLRRQVTLRLNHSPHLRHFKHRFLQFFNNNTRNNMSLQNYNTILHIRRHITQQRNRPIFTTSSLTFSSLSQGQRLIRRHLSSNSLLRVFFPRMNTHQTCSIRRPTSSLHRTIRIAKTYNTLRRLISLSRIRLATIQFQMCLLSQERRRRVHTNPFRRAHVNLQNTKVVSRIIFIIRLNKVSRSTRRSNNILPTNTLSRQTVSHVRNTRHQSRPSSKLLHDLRLHTRLFSTYRCFRLF